MVVKNSLPLTCLLAVSLVALGACQPTRDQNAPPGLPTIDISSSAGFPLDAHLEIADIAAGSIAFDALFDAGDSLFHTPYQGPDGVGVARLPDGTPVARFATVPPGGGAPAPISSQSCGECHFRSASGPASQNVAGDPDEDGQGPFNTRNTTSLFGDGILQMLAWEMTEELQEIRDQTIAAAGEAPGTPVEKALVAKGVDYGTLVATAGADGEVDLDLSRRQGIDPDLVVRPLGWKGNVTNLRPMSLAPRRS